MPLNPELHNRQAGSGGVRRARHQGPVNVPGCNVEKNPSNTTYLVAFPCHGCPQTRSHMAVNSFHPIPIHPIIRRLPPSFSSVASLAGVGDTCSVRPNPIPIMPRNSCEPTLARQWELLKLIPRHRPGATARELCERLKNAGHEVTKRTVERDLPDLSIVFPLMCNDASVPYGWHWKPEISFDIPGIALAEAVSLGLLEDLLRQLVPPTFVTALEGRFNAAGDKLRSLPQNPYSKWTDLVRYLPPGLPFLPPIIQPGVLETVQEALLGRRQIRAVYHSAAASAAKIRVLHPLALIQQGTRSYLLAKSPDHANLIQYALHRFQSAELLAAPAKVPRGFSLDEFLAAGGAQFGQGASITLKATVSDELATILRETPLDASQTLVTRDERTTLTASVKDSWQLGFWLLSQGPAITVLKPVALRRKTIAMLTEALANYATQ